MVERFVARAYRSEGVDGVQRTDYMRGVVVDTEDGRVMCDPLPWLEAVQEAEDTNDLICHGRVFFVSLYSPSADGES